MFDAVENPNKLGIFRGTRVSNSPLQQHANNPHPELAVVPSNRST